MIFQNSREAIFLYCFFFGGGVIAALCFFQKILALEMDILNVTKSSATPFPMKNGSSGYGELEPQHIHV